MKPTLIVFLAVTICAMSLTATEPESISLRVGMSHADALASLERVGKPFACSYLYGSLSGKPLTYFTYKWFTLPNGMSIEIHGDKQTEDQELLVTHLALCNSTMLFCCKGETWYSVDSVSVTAETPSLQNPRPARGASSAEGPFLLKGMPVTNVTQLLHAVGAKSLTASQSWLAKMPKTGRWKRYTLKGNRDMELILNYGAEEASLNGKLQLILIEATAPKRADARSTRYTIECEMLDLSAPLTKEWHWAFGPAWSWKPEEEGTKSLMKSAGQRR